MTIDTIATIEALRASLSPGRLARYEGATNGPGQTLALYAWNARVSAELFILLHGLEVTLRNAFDRELRARYGDDWVCGGNLPLAQQELGRIDEARKELERLGGNTKPDDLVAALSFGFWVGLLQKRYDQTLWRHALYRACRHAGAPKQRSALHATMDALRILRNRVAHHEPVFHRHLQADVAALTRAIAWCCPATAEWYGSIVDIDAALTRNPLVPGRAPVGS